MKKTLLICLAFFCGCSHPAVKPTLPNTVSRSEPTVDSYFDYDVTFTVGLSQGRNLSVKAETRPWLYQTVSYTDSLQQTDGKWVVFDCDNIADRIIIPGLIEEITPYCKSLHQQAEDFWKQNGYEPE